MLMVVQKWHSNLKLITHEWNSEINEQWMVWTRFLATVVRSYSKTINRLELEMYFGVDTCAKHRNSYKYVYTQRYQYT